MRKSEIRWLTWGDVDMTNGWVHVVAKPGWTPKSGERAIALDEQLVDFLKSWREELGGKGIPTEAGDWVAPFMPTESGLGAGQVELGVQWTANRISYDIVAIFEASGVERPAGAAHRLHMLRGCYAVELRRSGTDLETLKELLGHADLKTTAAYLEASAESKRRAVSRLRGAASSRAD